MDGGEQLGRQPWVMGPQKKMKFGGIFLRVHILDATCIHYKHVILTDNNLLCISNSVY